MKNAISLGFKTEQLQIPINNIFPIKLIPKSIRNSMKYKQISVSIKEVGLVEPLVVYPQKDAPENYMLLDGHLRLEVLKTAGEDHAPCMIAKDDESFTYNKRISRLATIQEHYMILKAIKKGVPEQRIAKTLGVNISRIRQKRNLLNGICDEAVDILKDRHFPGGTIYVIRKMKPVRQVEIAELMVAANNFSISYAKALLFATPDEQLCDPKSKKPLKGITEEERLRMEREMEMLRRDMKAVEEDYGTNVVRLVVANGYVSRLLENEYISHYMNRHHNELYSQLHSLTETLSQESSLNR